MLQYYNHLVWGDYSGEIQFVYDIIINHPECAHLYNNNNNNNKILFDAFSKLNALTLLYKIIITWTIIILKGDTTLKGLGDITLIKPITTKTLNPRPKFPQIFHLIYGNETLFLFEIASFWDWKGRKGVLGPSFWDTLRWKQKIPKRTEVKCVVIVVWLPGLCI